MKVLTLNSGSSSAKCALYDLTSLEKPLLLLEKESSSPSFSKKELKEILEECKETPDVFGHRIVHGGSTFTKSTLLGEKEKKELVSLSSLAPLHSKGALEMIKALEELAPEVSQVAVFDTAFHHTMPEMAKVYPLPYTLYEEGLQKYGFHGISYQSAAAQAEKMLGKMPQKHVICHLGSGSSLCAVLNGISIETTMGFTPLDGLMMGTRSGSIDPSALLFLLQEKKLSPKELSTLLYEESGLLGVSGSSSDMQALLQEIEKGDKRATLAFDLYTHKVIQGIGSMITSLGGIDALTFTGGIGENSPLLREEVCRHLGFLSLSLDKELNRSKGKADRILSHEGSSITTFLIHAKEGLEIAYECEKTLKC